MENKKKIELPDFSGAYKKDAELDRIYDSVGSDGIKDSIQLPDFSSAYAEQNAKVPDYAENEYNKKVNETIEKYDPYKAQTTFEKFILPPFRPTVRIAQDVLDFTPRVIVGALRWHIDAEEIAMKSDSKLAFLTFKDIRSKPNGVSYPAMLRDVILAEGKTKYSKPVFGNYYGTVSDPIGSMLSGGTANWEKKLNDIAERKLESPKWKAINSLIGFERAIEEMSIDMFVPDVIDIARKSLTPAKELTDLLGNTLPSASDYLKIKKAEVVKLHARQTQVIDNRKAVDDIIRRSNEISVSKGSNQAKMGSINGQISELASKQAELNQGLTMALSASENGITPLMSVDAINKGLVENKSSIDALTAQKTALRKQVVSQNKEMGEHIKRITPETKRILSEVLEDIDGKENALNVLRKNIPQETLDEIGTTADKAVKESFANLKVSIGAQKDLDDVIAGLDSTLERPIKVTTTTTQTPTPKEGLLYRGQSEQFEELRKVADSDVVGNILFGKGVFTTSDEEIAKSYGKKLFKFEKPKNAKVFDINTASNKTLKEFGITQNEIDGLAIWKSSPVEYETRVADLIIEKNYPAGVVDDMLKRDMAKESAISKIQELGYDFWKHKGGIRAGDSPHDVYVAITDDALKQFEEFKTVTKETIPALPFYENELKKRLKNIDDAMKYADDLQENLAGEIERTIKIGDIRRILRDSDTKMKQIAEAEGTTKAAVKARQSVKLWDRNALNDYAKRQSMGSVKDWEKLDRYELSRLHENIKTTMAEMPETLRVWNRAVMEAQPDWRIFEKLGVPHLNADLRNYWRLSEGLLKERNKFIKTQEHAYSETFKKKWAKMEDEVAVYFAEEGDAAIIPANILAQFSEDQIDHIRKTVAGDRTMWNELGEVAVSQGLMTKSRVKSMETGMPLFIENYYPHVRALKDNITGEYKKAFKEKYGYELDDVIKMQMSRDATDIAKYKELNAKFKSSLDQDLINMYGRKTFKRMPTDINISNFHKRIRDDDLFARDWRQVTESAYRSEVRKIYLEPVIKRGESFIKAMPESTVKNSIDKHYRRAIRVHRGMGLDPETMLGKIDEAFNKGAYYISKEVIEDIMPRVGLKDLANTMNPNTRAYDKFASMIKRGFLRGTMQGNMRPVVKNLFQPMHTVSTIGMKSTVEGIKSMHTKGGRNLLNKYISAYGRVPLEDFRMHGVIGKIDQVGLMPNTLIERYWNVASAGNGAMYRLFKDSPSRMKELAEFAVENGYSKKMLAGTGFWDVLDEAVGVGRFKTELEIADRNIRFTQWSYHKMDLPPLLQSSVASQALMYQNWTMNYFTSYFPQLMKQLMGGKSVLGEPLKWTDPERYAILWHAGATAAIFYTAKEMGVDVSWMLPTMQYPAGRVAGKQVFFPVSPPVAMALDLGQIVYGALTNNDGVLDEGWRRLSQYDFFTAVPAGVAIRNAVGVAVGEKPPEALFVVPLKDKDATGGRTKRATRSRRSSGRVGR